MTSRRAIVLLAATVVAFAFAGFFWWRAQPSVAPPDLSALAAPSRQQVEAAQRASREIARSFTASRTEKAAAWGQLGEVYLAYSLPAAAIDCFRVAIRLTPADFRWHYFYAEALSEMGETARSAPVMANAYTAMQSDTRAREVDRVAALCFLGSVAMRLNRPADARRTLQAALELAPGEPFALFSLGQLAARENDTKAAIDYFREALTRMPGRREILIPLADQYRRLGDTAEASRILQQVDGVATTRPLLWPDPLRASLAGLNESSTRQARLARELLKQGRWRPAAVKFAAAVATEPDNALHRMGYARALLGLEMLDEARAEVAKARQLDPENEQSLELENLVLAMAPATSEQALRAAMDWNRRKPDSSTALQNLAEVQFHMARYADALNTLHEAEVRQPAETDWRFTRARVLAAMGRYREARQELATATRTKPDDTELKLNYARILACSAGAEGRDGKLAVDLSRQLMAIQKTAMRMESLAVALAETGQFDEPRRLLAEAIGIVGTDGQPATIRRLNAELRSFEARQPWRERWIFEDRK